ncbi:MAG: hypothetical protein ACKO3I_01675 [Synechococcales cyanobacterium]
MKKIAFYFSLGLSLAFFLATLVSLGQTDRGINGLTSKLIGTLQFGVLFASLAAYFRYFHHSKLSLIWNPKTNQNQSFPLKRSETALIFSLNLFLFIGLSYYRFSKYHNLLFSDVDGDYMVSLFYSQRLWNDNELSYFTANFLQGLGGNIIFPLNTLIDPAYLISGLLGRLDHTLVHVVWAVLLFLSTFLFSNIIGLTFGVSILAAWMAPLSILYPQPFEFFNVTRLIPHLCTSISVCLLLLSLIWLNKTKVHWLIIRAVAIILLGLYLVASNPGYLLVIFPILLTFALFRIKLVIPYELGCMKV